jgi:hypothetical protein
MRTELFLGPKWEPTDRRVYLEVVSDGMRRACGMRLPYPTANEAVSFFRDNWTLSMPDNAKINFDAPATLRKWPSVNNERVSASLGAHP